MFKAIKIIRVIEISKKIKSLKIIIISLYKSIPMLINLIIFTFVMFLCIALFPFKYLKGALYSCKNIEEESILEHISTKSQCFDYGGDYINKDFHWDNIIMSVYNIYIIATAEGWVYLMFDAIDATNID